MYKVISLKAENGNSMDVPFLANAATPFRFKAIFGKDLLVLFQTCSNDGVYDIDFVSQLAYTMAMQAEAKNNGRDMTTLGMVDMIAWLEQFDGFEMLNKAKDIIEVYLGNSNTSSKEKKKVGKQSAS
jgi:hypothetical protein